MASSGTGVFVTTFPQGVSYIAYRHFLGAVLYTYLKIEVRLFLFLFFNPFGIPIQGKSNFVVVISFSFLASPIRVRVDMRIRMAKGCYSILRTRPQTGGAVGQTFQKTFQKHV